MKKNILLVACACIISSCATHQPAIVKQSPSEKMSDLRSKQLIAVTKLYNVYSAVEIHKPNSAIKNSIKVDLAQLDKAYANYNSVSRDVQKAIDYNPSKQDPEYLDKLNKKLKSLKDAQSNFSSAVGEIELITNSIKDKVIGSGGMLFNNSIIDGHIDTYKGMYRVYSLTSNSFEKVKISKGKYNLSFSQINDLSKRLQNVKASYVVWADDLSKLESLKTRTGRLELLMHDSPKLMQYKRVKKIYQDTSRKLTDINKAIIEAHKDSTI